MFGIKAMIDLSNAEEMHALARGEQFNDGFLGLALQNVVGNPGLQRAPLAPALQCVTLLAILFFGLYLAVIFVRLLRLCSSWARKHCFEVEAAIARATGSLEGAPIFCVLALSARIRATQLDPAKGKMEPWLPLCMYMSTAALVLRCAVSLVLQSESGLSASGVALRSLCSLVLYASSAALACGVFAMHPAEASEAFPHLPMARCLLALVGLNLLLLLGVEVSEITERSRGKAPLAQERSLATMPTVAMFCVLLLAMSLRSVQLHVSPAPWTTYAMYATTAVLTLQALISVGDASVDALGLPSGVDPEGPVAPPAPPAQRAGQWALAACACFGVVAVVAGVHSMEPGKNGEAPALSVAMWCVAWLAVVYFAVCVLLVLVRAAGASQKGAAATRNAAPALAFSPMLCAMIVSVRLRAVMLHRRDPPFWAQVAMYCAAFALTTQALASVLLAACNADEDDDNERSASAKMASIFLLVIQYVAAAVLYMALSALIAALFVMSAME